MPRTHPAYCTEEDLKDGLPAQWLTEAADDDDDGDGETMADVLNGASDTVDAFLQGRYELPIADAAGLTKLKEATKTRALFLMWQRRGRHGENNPWLKEWERWAKHLGMIEAGAVELITRRVNATPPASPAKIHTVGRAMRTVPTSGTAV